MRHDRFVARARPAFLYAMYALLLGGVPVGLLGTVRPAAAAAFTRAFAAYLAAIPEPLYALFATGYVGYAAARSWDKSRAAAAPPPGAVSPLSLSPPPLEPGP